MIRPPQVFMDVRRLWHNCPRLCTPMRYLAECDNLRTAVGAVTFFACDATKNAPAP